jgi:putative transcriptional regulator
MQSLQGHLLVASPYLVESPFSQTVVLLLQHTRQGAWGLVLNRPEGPRIRDFWAEVSDQPCEIQRPVNLGGPVSGPVIAVHSCPAFAEAEVPPGVFLASQRDNLDHIVEHPDLPFLLFIGHSGWTPGQLESELAQGVWHVTPATVEQIFGDDDRLWQDALLAIGHAFTRDVLKIKHIPPDVAWN